MSAKIYLIFGLKYEKVNYLIMEVLFRKFSGDE